MTDLGNAERLIKRHGRRLSFVTLQEQWLIWDGRRWSRDQLGRIYFLAKDTVRSMYAEAATLDNEDERRALSHWAARSESASKIESMIRLAESDVAVAVTPDQLDRDPWLLNCHNGTVDLRTGEVRDHRQDDLITRMAPVHYDPEATSRLWLKFLTRIMAGDHDRIDFLQRAIGYSLVGVTTEQLLFFMYGVGANGKTTLVRTVMAMMGDYARQAEPELLVVRHGEVHPTGVADLMGARLVACMEVEDGRRLAEVLVKQLTGGDKIKARFMRQDFFEFEPTHTIWLAANHKPVVRGTDHAIWRRIRLIPFIETIPDAEQDHDLLEKLRVELPGILAWAVEGCLQWQATGLGQPETVRAATEAYRQEMDWLGQFLEERCVIDAKAEVSAKALYVSYGEWCEAGRERPATQTAFGLRLRERGFTRDPRRTGIWWKGLGLSTHHDPAVKGVNSCEPSSDMSTKHAGPRETNEKTVHNRSPFTPTNGNGHHGIDLDDDDEWQALVAAGALHPDEVPE